MEAVAPVKIRVGGCLGLLLAVETRRGSVEREKKYAPSLFREQISAREDEYVEIEVDIKQLSRELA